LSYLQEGRYEYKYIVDGVWTCNNDELVTSPNKDGHVNNFIQVSYKLQLNSSENKFCDWYLNPRKLLEAQS